MPPRPRVLTVGGVDPCGGAGITADVRMIQVRGAEAVAVPTCWTVQNRYRFDAHVSIGAGPLRRMLDAVTEDGPLAAIKTGWFPDTATMDVFARWYAEHARGTSLVVDPVLGASVDGSIDGAERASAFTDVVMPLGPVLTPNHPELRALTRDGDPAELLAAGCVAVLVKDGHGAGPRVTDRLFWNATERTFARRRLARGPVHGTGCALATAFASHLAHGMELESACARAVRDLERCLRETPASIAGRPEPLRIL